MHTVELLRDALALAESLGYGIRHEWLGGSVGGSCEIAGKKWLFVDLALNPVEQLDQVLQSIKQDPRIHTLGITGPLGQLLELRRAA